MKEIRLGFEGATAKLTIGSLDQPDLTVKADYNPKELGLSKTLQWKEHNEGDKDALAGKKKSKSEQDSLEMTGVPKKTMSIELLFDGFEQGISVAKRVQILEDLSSPQVQMDRREDKRRPHFCVVVWGQKGIAPFRCVIDKLDVKYTMFDRQGTPLRATCTVSLTEAQLKVSGDIEGNLSAVYSKSRFRGSERAITVINAPGLPPPPSQESLDDLE
jgi:hypothetical protein